MFSLITVTTVMASLHNNSKQTRRQNLKVFFFWFIVHVCNPSHWEVIAGGAWGSCSRCKHSQEAERDKCWCPIHLLHLYSIQDPNPQNGSAHIQVMIDPYRSASRPSQNICAPCRVAQNLHVNLHTSYCKIQCLDYYIHMYKSLGEQWKCVHTCMCACACVRTCACECVCRHGGTRGK